ncbi:MAG: ATP-binding protein, partial [Jatrophihabitantaceae bacterium]
MSTTPRPARSSTTVDLPADPRSPALARRHVTGALRGGRSEPLLDDALLLVTELVTNAIMHAATSARLTIDTTDRSTIRFEVVDRSPTTIPTLRTASQSAAGGRGLQLLNALSTSWGTVHTASEKSVWFTLGTAPDRETSQTPTAPTDSAAGWPSLAAADTEMRLLRWLLMLDVMPAIVDVLPDILLTESVHRLCDALAADSAVLLDYRADRPGYHPVLAERGAEIAEDDRAAAIASAEGDRALPSQQSDRMRAFRVALSAETLAVLIIAGDGASGEVDTIAVELTCWRLATILNQQRLQTAADRARGNAALLAEASELFAGALDSDLALNLATQLVVPRFGTWAAVWTMADHRPALSAVSHQREGGVQQLRDVLGAIECATFVGTVSTLLSGGRSALIAAADLPSGLRAIGTGEV